MTIDTDTLNRAMLVHQKMTEAGFPLTEIEEVTGTHALVFRFAGPTFENSHDLQNGFGYGARSTYYHPPSIKVTPTAITISGNLNDVNQTTVFKDTTPSDLTGRLSEQVHKHMKQLDNRRTWSQVILNRLTHMTRFLGDTEHDWPKRNASAVWRGGDMWEVESVAGLLQGVPVHLVTATRDLMEQYPRNPAKGKLATLDTFLSEVSWARHILSLELPAIPKVPKKFRSFANDFNTFQWSPLPVLD
jgi:hypothetical protein